VLLFQKFIKRIDKSYLLFCIIDLQDQKEGKLPTSVQFQLKIKTTSFISWLFKKLLISKTYIFFQKNLNNFFPDSETVHYR